MDDNKYNYDYYYVLHYILDMDWCHLVPLQAKSHFGGESFRAGRPRFRVLGLGIRRELPRWPPPVVRAPHLTCPCPSPHSVPLRLLLRHICCLAKAILCKVNRSKISD